MVGVPRSKGCVNCRARRKGCDAERPSCGQCLSRGVACKGYTDELMIRFEDPAAKEMAKSRRNQATLARDALEPSLTTLSNLPQPCRASAFRIQAFGRYLETYLPHLSSEWPELQTNLNILPSTSWLPLAASAHASNPLLSNALSAVAFAHLAKGEHGHDFSLQSRASYLRAIQGVNVALQKEQHSLDDHTLAAVMALSIYEVSNFHRPYFMDWTEFRAQMQEGSSMRANGWVSHIRGAQTLIRLRGSRNFSNAFSERLFLGSRLTEVISAIGARKASPTGQLWSVAHDPTNTSTHIQLFEILNSLPALMELADNITPGEGNGISVENQSLCTTLYTMLINQKLEFESDLVAWYSTLETQQQHLGPLYFPATSTLYAQLPESCSIRNLPFHNFLCFPDSEIAQQVVLYWTALVLADSTLWLAKGRLMRAGYHAPSLPPPSLNRMYSPIASVGSVSRPAGRPVSLEALLIAQSLEYFVHPDMGFLGANFVGFPMAVAQGLLQHFQAPELAWFDVIFARLRQMGSGLNGFLHEMAHGTGDAQLRLLKV